MDLFRFSAHKGYSSTFEFDGDYIDCSRYDKHGRKDTKIVAMDALFFHNPEDQFQSKLIERELNKAYCAFLSNTPSQSPPVATGNWG